jgi:hypothetical protein
MANRTIEIPNSIDNQKFIQKILKNLKIILLILQGIINNKKLNI